jgi:hypothetical protein
MVLRWEAAACMGTYIMQCGKSSARPVSSPDKSSSKKAAAKLILLQATIGATFFRPRLGPTRSITYRNVAFLLSSVWGIFR